VEAKPKTRYLHFNGLEPPVPFWTPDIAKGMSVRDFALFLEIDKDQPAVWFKEEVLEMALYFREQDPIGFQANLANKVREYVNPAAWFTALFEAERNRVVDFPHTETLAELGAADIPPLEYVIQELLHEGLWLFAGLSKRGKSWMLLDMCMAIAAGRSAFGHYATKKRGVLYIALEDGRRRIRDRAKTIQSDLSRLTNFHVVYEFPKMDASASATLERGIKKHDLGVVVIDVLGGLLGDTPRNKTEYQSIYAQFSPLRALANQYHLPIILVDHLRKADAEDIAQRVQGSYAKVGASDSVAILERKEDDDEALLHIQSKESKNQTIAIQFYENRVEYLGEGSAYKLKKETSEILTALSEEKKPMSVRDIMNALGVENSPKHYSRFRKTLQRLFANDLVAKTSRGMFAASRSMAEEEDARHEAHAYKDSDEVPF
jgi:RecA-family ATPase